MRRIPIRGEKIKTKDGIIVQIIDIPNNGKSHLVRVISPTDHITFVEKDLLELEIIDTKNYEKITADEIAQY